MNSSYQALQGLFTSFTRSAAAAEKVFSLMDSIADIGSIDGSGEPINWRPFEGQFELRSVHFFYQMRPDNMVLKGLDLVVPGGKVTALVGRSGGGKSTIISMLMRFYDPRDGSITLDGRDLKTLRVGDLRRLIGVVAQDTPLFARSIRSNIAYGLEDHEYTMDEVVEAAKKAQCHEFITAMKDGKPIHEALVAPRFTGFWAGYDTRVGERGGRVSGGQRQRIAIARIFLRRPKICLLDEATSALDEDSQAAVQEALDSLISLGGATVVLVAHRLSTVMNADKIAVIDGGVVIEEGSHSALVERGGVYANLVRKQTLKRAALIDQGSSSSQQPSSIDQLLDDLAKDKEKEKAPSMTAAPRAAE